MEEYTIKDLERLTGIKSHTLRVWERRYSLLDPGRTPTNRRRYSAADLRRIINVSILNRNGMKISAIASLTDNQLEEKVSSLLTGASEAGAELDALLLAMLSADREALENIYRKSVLSRGFEATVTSLVFPLLKRIGVMWQTGTVDPGYEHFVTAFFRNKLITALDLLSPATTSRGRVLFFLPENELHEMALIFYTYIARQSGYETLYLGQATPLESALIVAERWKPDFVVTGVLTSISGNNRKQFVNRLSETFSNYRVLVAGLLAELSGEALPSNVIAVKSPDELRANMSAS